MRTRSVVLGVVVAGAISLATYLTFFDDIDSGWPAEAFTSERWAAKPANERYRLVKDLIRSRTLEAKSPSEVEQLLGPPNYRSPDGGYWLYTVQNRDTGVGGFNAVAMMNVDFDRTPKVSRIYVRAD